MGRIDVYRELRARGVRAVAAWWWSGTCEVFDLDRYTLDAVARGLAYLNRSSGGAFWDVPLAALRTGRRA